MTIRALQLWTMAGLMAAALGGPLCQPARAQATSPATQPETKPPAAPAPQAAEVSAEVRETWRRSLAQTPRPKRGCFSATYPETTWKEVQCGKAPNKPYPPRAGLRGQTVGNGVDYSANTNGATTAADGAFVTVTGVTSESTVQPGQPTGVANQFSLQLNTQFFTTQTCNGASNPGQCQGWEQFVVSNDPTGASYVFIQYWLINYNNACPAGWNTYSNDCYVNSNQATPYPTVAIGQLSQLAVTGTAGSGGGDDAATLSVGTTSYTATGNNYFPDLGQHWQTSEYNIFGDCCGSSAVFNAGSTIKVQTAVNYGSSAAPNCAMEGFTGETNNLTLVGTPTSAPKVTWPSITFTQSNGSSPTPASCATATSVGDTHIMTFAGQAYDFQAAGEFLLLDNGSNFTVHSNQVSGAPSWPNTSVNGAISVQMQNISIVVPAAGQTITVNGTPFTMQNGQSRSFGPGVQVTHNGAGFVVSSPSGDRVEAFQRSAKPNYIDVFVYPGRPLTAKATGALVGKTQKQFVPAKVSFKDMYSQYAKSWQVAGKASRFTGKTAVPFALPTQPFYAKDLTAAQQEHGRSVCKAAGVTDEVLLQQCVLDVTVIGNDQAADVFAHLPPPKSSIIPE